MIMRRFGDFVYTYQFHVPCGSYKHVLCFLFPLLQAVYEGDPKWSQLFVSCHVHCHLTIYQLS